MSRRPTPRSLERQGSHRRRTSVQDTLQELARLRFAYVGDANNVAHSLMEAGALAGMQVIVATHPDTGPITT